MADFELIGDLLDQILAELKTVDIPLNRQQAAAFVGCSPHTIDNYRDKGYIKLTCRHNLVGYLKEDLMKIVKCKSL